MTSPLSVDELIARAKHYVRTGGIIEVILPSGTSLEYPVAILSLVPDYIWFLFSSSDHAHGGAVDWIRDGEDQRVEVLADHDNLFRIWPTWNKQQDDELEAWLAGTKVQMIYLPVSPPPPDQVRYEGHPA